MVIAFGIGCYLQQIEMKARNEHKQVKRKRIVEKPTMSDDEIVALLSTNSNNTTVDTTLELSDGDEEVNQINDPLLEIDSLTVV